MKEIVIKEISIDNDIYISIEIDIDGTKDYLGNPRLSRGNITASNLGRIFKDSNPDFTVKILDRKGESYYIN